MTYSTLFGSSRLTTSPFPTPVDASSRAVRFTAASNSAYVNSRPSASEKRKALSGAALTRCFSSSGMVRGSFLIISPDVIAFSLRISAFLCASAVGDLFYRRGAEIRRDKPRFVIYFQPSYEHLSQFYRRQMAGIRVYTHCCKH